MSQDSAIHKICIYGIGGVGGYFGSKISSTINAKKHSSYESYFIAKEGPHLEAIKRNGIKVISPEKVIHAVPTIAKDDINEIPTPDLFLLCVKSYDLDKVVASIRPKVNDKTLVVPLLNGVDIYDRIRANLNGGIVLPACVFVGTHIQEPGVIQQNGGDGKILLGKDPRHPSFDAAPVIRVFNDMAIDHQWHDDPFPAIWSKYIFIASFGLMSAETGKSLGEIMADGMARNRVRGIMREISEIAQRKGIKLSPALIEESINKANNFPYDARTSYQRDIELKGDLNEGDLYGGTIIREGKALGVPTPATSAVYSAIQSRSL